MRTRLRHVLTAGLAAAVLSTGLVLAGTAPAGADTQICDQFGSTTVDGGRYVVQNDEWNDTSPQCVNATDDGFSVTTASHDVPQGGPPAGYPDIYAGCNYGLCTSDSGLPLPVSAFGHPTSTVDYTTTAAGQYDAAYDIWFDTQPTAGGQNDGAEIMIWGNHQGPPQPFGALVGTANFEGATWDVWEGRQDNGIAWNVISYVREQTTNSLDVSLKDFTDDAGSRGYLDSSWYLTSVQFGFEPWVGGQGLGVSDFSYNS
jgi:hypothetical protein